MNYYSKFSRSRDKQDIDSLHRFVDRPKKRSLEGMDDYTYVFNKVKESHSDMADLPLSMLSSRQSRTLLEESLNYLDVSDEDERAKKFAEMEEKLKTLQEIEKNFHEQLKKSEREYQRKKEIKEAQRREREKYRDQINHFIERAGPMQRELRTKESPSLRIDPLESEEEPQDDHYYKEPPPAEVRKDVKSVDLKDTKRRLKQMFKEQDEDEEN